MAVLIFKILKMHVNLLASNQCCYLHIAIQTKAVISKAWHVCQLVGVVANLQRYIHLSHLLVVALMSSEKSVSH